MNVASRFRTAERGCAMLLLVAPIVSGALLLATAGYLAWCGALCLAFLDFDMVVYVAPPVVMIATFVVFRRALPHAKGEVRLHAALFAATALSLASSRAWFAGPMHDIALAFGSHGRFGDLAANEDGSSVYLFTDETMPWLLFGPPLLGVVGHWLVRRRQR